MAAAEGVKHVRHHEVELGHLPRGQRLWSLEAVSELGPHHVASNQFLKTIGVDVDQFDHPVAIGSRRRDKEGRADRARDRQILGHRVAAIRRDIGASLTEPLVLGHVVGVHVGTGTGNERHRLGGVGHPLLERITGRRLGRLEREGLPSAEIDRPGRAFLGRPSLEGPPSVRPGLEDIRLRVGSQPLALEIALEERQQDGVLILFRGIGAEGELPDGGARVAGPLAVVPGADHDGVIGPGALALDGFEQVDRAVEVVGVVPTPDGQHRGRHVLDMGQNGAGLPEIVVGAVLHHLGPPGHLAFEILGVGVGEGAHPEKELVAIGGAEVERPAARHRRAGA